MSWFVGWLLGLLTEVKRLLNLVGAGFAGDNLI